MKAALASFTRLAVDISDRSNRKAGKILEDLNVTGLPTLVFLDGEGNESGRIVGAQPAGTIIAAAKKAQGAQ